MSKDRNDNCLDGMRCPRCGALEPFSIRNTCWTVWTDEGSGESDNHEWELDDKCKCLACGHWGDVRGFTIEEAAV